jgi:hypothetical protein
MTRKYWLNLGPRPIIGLGIIVATLAATLAAGWWVMTGPALLALFVVCADLFEARSRGEHWVPSLRASIVAGEVLAAGLIMALSDPGSVKLITVLGGAACISVVSRSRSDRWVCRYF